MPEFEFTNLAIGGVALVWLLPRLVQCFKVWGLQGTKNIYLVTFLLGGGLAGLTGAIALELVPAIAMPWIQVGVYVVAGGVAAVGAIGEYELQKLRR